MEVVLIQIEQIINSIFGQRKKPGRVEKGPVGLQRTRCRYIKVITDFPRDAYDESRLAINNICNLCYKLILCKGLMVFSIETNKQNVCFREFHLFVIVLNKLFGNAFWYNFKYND